MPIEVYEWFAKLGYVATLAMMQKEDLVDGGPDHMPKLRFVCCDETDQITVSFGSEDRRVVYDDDFGWLWYNAEGPEE